MTTDEKIIETYNSFKGRIADIKNENDHVERMMIISMNGMFNSFKLWFSTDLQRLGLDERFDYYLKEQPEKL